MLNTEQVSEGVCRITLASPEDRNALSHDMRQAILAGVRGARRAGAKVVIIRGDERAFSSGYKLDPGVMRPRTLTEDRARLVEVTDFLGQYRADSIITIAQVQGYCVAGGTDLMLASDLAVVADDAAIGVPNVRGLGITMLLPVWSWLVGPQRAKLLALTGDYLTGAEASSYGLVAASVPVAELGARVEALAARIALMPQELLEVVKQALNTAWDSSGFTTTMVRAAELDALSHGTEPVIGFWDRVQADGMRVALQQRDGRFSEGRAIDTVLGGDRARTGSAPA